MSPLPDYLDVPAAELGRGTNVKLAVKNDMAAIGQAMAEDMLGEILRAQAEGRNATLIVPVGPVEGFPVLAEKLRREKISRLRLRLGLGTPKSPSARSPRLSMGDCCLIMWVKPLMPWIESAGLANPWFFVGLFLAASFLMIWRLESMAADGMEGTVLGTLIMPYCTGMGNLIFAIVLGMRGGSGAEVVTNCLVNNVTNLTLLVGLPAALWGMSVIPEKKAENYSHHLNRLSMLLTLFAVVFFTGTAWALGRDREIGFTGGLILVGLFLFWQAFHVFEVLKTNRRQNKSFGPMLPIDLVLLAIGAYGTYLSTDWLVGWVSNIKTGFVSAQYMGWLSGWLDVLPNGLLAFYYGWKRKAEVVYTSQVGDGHICIPLCIGIFALYKPITAPPFFQTGVLILIGATLVHLIFIGIWGRLPRKVGWLLTAAYGLFLYRGLIK